MQATSSRSMARTRLKLGLIATVIAATAAIAVPASASAAESSDRDLRRDICLIEVPIFGGCAFSIPTPSLPASSLSGTAQEGQTLSCANNVLGVPVLGSLLNALPKTWKFQRNGGQVQSGGSSSYGLGESDIGSTLTCTLQIGGAICVPNPLPFGPSCFSVGSISITSGLSNGRGPVDSAPFSNTAVPQAQGSAVEGSTLTCSQGTFNPATSVVRSYQWLRNGVLVSSGQTRLLNAADVGQAITCRVNATRHGKSASGTSASRTPTASAISNTALPTISGTAQDGQTVTCNPGSWSQTPESSSFEWLRNGSVVGSDANYTLAAADVGQQVKCRQNVSRLGQSNSAESAAITPSAKPVVNNNSGGTNQGTGTPTNQGTGTPTNTNAAKKALAKKRAAAIKRCNKRFKKKSQRKKRAACVKKAKKKYAFKG